MHFIPSVARNAATKIAQTAKAGKAKIFLRSCAALCLLLLCLWGFSEAVYKVTAGGWEAGRRAWKARTFTFAGAEQNATNTHKRKFSVRVKSERSIMCNKKFL